MSEAVPRRPLPERLALLLLAVAVFFGHLLLASGHLMSPDEELLFRTAESLADRRSLSVRPLETDPATGQLLVPRDQTFATVLGRSGQFHVQYLPLQAVLAVPLVWIADATAPLLAEPFARTLPDTIMHPRLDAGAAWRRGVVVAVFNPLVAALTALVLWRMALFATAGNRKAAWGAALLWAFGTVAWPHSRTWFTEPLAGLLGLVATDQALRWLALPALAENARARLRSMIVLGAAMAGAIWTRMDSPLIAFGVGVAMAALREMLWHRDHAGARFPLRDYLVSGGIIVGSWLALLAFNAWRFDGNASVFGGGYSDQEEGVKLSTGVLVGLHGLLCSPGKGIFFFSPALALAVWGWFLARGPQRRTAAFVFWAWAPFALAMALWQNWDGGWCWGPRHIVQLHAPLMLGAAFLIAAGMTAARRVMIGVVAAVGAGVQMFGALQSPLDFYMEMFRTSDDAEYFSLAYRPMEVMDASRSFEVNVVVGDARRPVSPAMLPAPMVDSLYVPQHSQWAGYPQMLRMGYCDWWLLARAAGRPPMEASRGAQ